MTTYTVDGYSIGKLPKQKSDTLWATCSQPPCCFPLAYLRRPKNIVDDAHWELILSCIKIEIPVGTTIQYGEEHEHTN